MTLLSGVHNLGNAWATFVCLKLSGILDTTATGDRGFDILSWGCTAFGAVWLMWYAGGQLQKLQCRPMEDWRIKVD